LFIESLEAQLGKLVTSNDLSLRGSLAVSGTWVRAGLESAQQSSPRGRMYSPKRWKTATIRPLWKPCSTA
ncbi:hypothetical protein, partial [Limimaricola cinnabarinus]|uniref:hypothetical protein n=1 Tax=Limimaricola cinnabarinus TaxID=1125964 RepID=UPI001F167700